MENLATLAPYSFDALTSFMEIFRQLLFRPARELNTSALPARALKKVTGLSPREFRAENRPMSARRAREFIVRSGLHGALRGGFEFAGRAAEGDRYLGVAHRITAGWPAATWWNWPARASSIR